MKIAQNYVQAAPQPTPDPSNASQGSYDFQIDRTVGTPQKGDTIVWNDTTYTIIRIDHESDKSIWVSAEVNAE